MKFTNENDRPAMTQTQAVAYGAMRICWRGFWAVVAAVVLAAVWP